MLIAGALESYKMTKFNTHLLNGQTMDRSTCGRWQLASILLFITISHEKMGGLILKLAREASLSGEPIVKPMEYVFPNHQYENIRDQFVLGDDIIVTPVVRKGARSRQVALPLRTWKAENGKLFEGVKTVEINVPLDRLPYFQKISGIK